MLRHTRSGLASSRSYNLSLALLCALATTPSRAGNPATPGGPTPAELETFFDNFFGREMKEFDVRGGVVTVVRSGRTILSKGYGLADDAGTPVSPDNTVFRVGSVSKVVTAVAVMQLVERGQLDLHRDVNDYLTGYQLNDPKGVVSLHHLLTHTGGFDEHNIGVFHKENGRAVPLNVYLAHRFRPPVRPPGQFYAYSKWGMELAGYLVEVRSGMTFEQYAQDHILHPLGMTHSTFAPRPTPGEGVATGYYNRRGVRSVVPYPYLDDTPGAGLKATAADMGRLIAALLPAHSAGVGSAGGVLRPETIREMHRRQFGYHPELDGVTYGFREHRHNGLSVLVHPGLMPGFVCLICLIPDQDLGFFVACNNTHPREQFNATILTDYIDRFHPVAARPPSPGAGESAASLARFAGDYRLINYAHGTFEKLASAMRQVQVRVVRDGVLLIKREEWTQVGPDLFYRNGRYVHFLQDSNGRVTHLALGIEAAEKLPAWETLRWQLRCAAGFALTFAIACLAWPTAAFVSWLGRSPVRSRLPRVALVMALMNGLLNLVFLAGIIRTVSRSDYYDFLFGMPSDIVALLWIPLVTSGLALALLTLTARCWALGTGSLFGRVYLTLTSLAAAAFIPFLDYWNLIGFHY